LESVDLSGKTVALFGLGDQVGYPDEFVDALGIFYKKLKKLGAPDRLLVGGWLRVQQIQGGRDGEFVGLVLDQDNQADLTEERLEEWLERVKPENCWRRWRVESCGEPLALAVSAFSSLTPRMRAPC
jgi:flavodoxin I